MVIIVNVCMGIQGVASLVTVKVGIDNHNITNKHPKYKLKGVL